MASLTEVDAFIEKFEKEFSLVSFVSSCSSSGPKDVGRWIVDNGYSSHMTRIRDVFLDSLKTGLDRLVHGGEDSVHVVRGVGCVRFHLDIGEILEVS